MSERAPLVLFNYNWSGHIPAAHVRYVVAAGRITDRRIISLSAEADQVRQQVLAALPEVESKLETPLCAALGHRPARDSSLRFIRHLPGGDWIWRRIRTNSFLRAQHAARRWGVCGDLLRRHLDREPALVFFPYVDDMIERHLRPPTVARAMPAPWGGVYMDSSDLRVTRRRGNIVAALQLFAAEQCRGLAVFDEAVVPELKRALPGKLVRRIPDIVDYAVAGRPPAMLKAIRDRAAGRPIIGLFGQLTETKNLGHFLRMAARPENQDLFFAVAGQYEPLGLSRVNRRLLEAAAAGRMSNVLAAPGRLPSDEEFNALVAGCDVLFAVYRDFSRSSSMLSKAPRFGRPLVVADGYYMGDCVKSYGLGECVRADEPVTWPAAIRRLLAGPLDGEGRRRFLADFSEEHFDAALGAFFEEALHV